MLFLLVVLAWVSERALLPLGDVSAGQVPVALGFLLLAAFLLGELVVPLKLPRISGYLLAGLIFGPDALGLVNEQSLESLKVIDSLALTFIALSAGGELQIDELKKGRRIIFSALVALVLVVFFGSTLLFMAARPLFAFTRELSGRELWVMAAVLGAIATARSPASAIAIIKELKARGPFTEVALGLTVAMDILAIVVFALVVSAGDAFLAGTGLDSRYIFGLLTEIGSSLALGTALGFALAAWLKRVDSHHLITVFLVAIVVSEAAHALHHGLDHYFGLSFHLEPMLICIAMGFVVRNFSSQGDRFLHVIEKGGLLIFTLFFALAGASLDLVVLRQTWMIAVLLVAIRFGCIQVGASLGARAAGAPRVYRKYLGFTFITQAGVSLGLAKAVEARFPGWGAAVATLAVASISINQLIGPVFFKTALTAAGETGKDSASERD